MTKNIVIFACIVALVSPLILTGCCSRSEFTRVKGELAQTQSERDRLLVRVRSLEQSQELAVESTDAAPGELQQQVNDFIKIRNALQQREDEMTKLRQAALVEAQTAQSLMNKLGTQLQAETEKVNVLQSQLQQTQQAVTELQNKLR